MRMSRMLVATLREEPREAEAISHKLMIRAGLIRKLASGLYTYLPMGYRVLKKVIDIVREEMDRAGALEMLPPILIPAELWEESGRLHVMGKEMMRIEDRNGNLLVLGPTHEEVFTDVVRKEVKSYKQLPLILYQIAPKIRDEIRPRFGVMRCREFIMKDAYSFDVDEEGLEKSYLAMREAYIRIFKRVGLETVIVEADVGAMGGTRSEEFMVLSNIGESTVLICKNCGYSASQEKAETQVPEETEVNTQSIPPVQEIDTPNVKTIEELTKFLNTSPDKFIKTLVYKADGKYYLVLIRGDLEVNETKLKNLLRAVELELAGPEEVLQLVGVPIGFLGPVGIKELAKGKIEIIADYTIKSIGVGITGANKVDKHIKNVVLGRDYEVDIWGDIRTVKGGDKCPKCGSILEEYKGIEVGHIFKLGYKYTESMKVEVLGPDGKALRPIMGCYGIGIDRTMAAIVEKNNDEYGIVWPITVAPFQVIVIPVNMKDKDLVETSFRIYENLLGDGVEVIIDDRDETAGVKFNDADLIGFPIRITVGKSYKTEGKVEIKTRDRSIELLVEPGKVVNVVKDIIAQKTPKL